MFNVTVDSIIRDLEEKVDKLLKISGQEDIRAEKYKILSIVSRTESDRAARIANKLKELIS